MERRSEAPLEYHGRPMRWEPTRVLCLQPHGPLDADEPADASLPGLVADGYSVFVRLEPGDGTRYGLLLAGNPEHLIIARVGTYSEAAIALAAGERRISAERCASLAAGNEWTAVFLSWWLTELRARFL